VQGSGDRRIPLRDRTRICGHPRGGHDARGVNHVLEPILEWMKLTR
jgi:hypothetical protein